MNKKRLFGKWLGRYVAAGCIEENVTFDAACDREDMERNGDGSNGRVGKGY